MESNYALYLKESSNKNIHEDEYGFFVYSIDNETLYIEEVFVKKEYRRKGIGKTYDLLAQEIAKDLGCRFLKGSVLPQMDKATESMMFQFDLGYRIDYCVPGIIFLIKEI